MALVVHQTQGFYAACTSQPVAWKGAKKMVPLVAYCHVGRISRCSRFRSHHKLSIVGSSGVRSVISARNQCLKALSFQGATKNEDSEGREGPKSSSSMDFSCAWKRMEEAEQNFPQSSQGLPNWFTKLQKQGFIQQANAILQNPQPGLKFLDQDQLIKQLQEGQVSQHIVDFWQNLEVWIKWPLAVFLLCFLAITVIFGIRASSDLLPLWIIGPLMMGTFIKSYLLLSSLCIRVTTDALVMVKAVTDKCVELQLIVKNGNLIQMIQLHVRQFFEAKRSEVVDYFRSGKFKELLWQKWKEFGEWNSERTQDFVESIWPQWRATTRFLKKIL
eukprot:Gb_33113 [translate_table: standard]